MSILGNTQKGHKHKQELDIQLFKYNLKVRVSTNPLGTKTHFPKFV